ncbi:MAG TPA: ABC transporter permease, partial [Candidatus Limnocylindria bacterium]
MYVSEAVRTSLSEILAHKLRSGLTLVGIVLGTTALVVMVSVIGGLAVSVQQGLTDLGFDGVIFVVPQKTQDRLEQKKEGYSRGLRSADAHVIEPGKEVIAEAAPMLSLGNETARLNGRTMRVAVEGVTPAWGRIRNRVPAQGRYLVERDVETRATVALIGHKLKQDVFGDEEALGREIVLRGVRFRVVGVLKNLGTDQVNDDEMERDNAKVYVPLTTAQQYFAGTDAVHAWAFQAPPEDLENAEKEAEALMRRSHRGITDFKVQNIGEEILRVRKEVDVLIANWRVVLASIAGISLLVGGIGIFSVMQISIGERTYEIGLRKAMGATDPEIFGQFLIESVSLSLVGGGLGALLGWGITL